MTSSSTKKLAYQKAYNARPDEIKRRSQRNQARKAYEKANGDLPTSVEVDHKRMVKDGGTNSPNNLRALPAKENRAWRKGKKGYD